MEVAVPISISGIWFPKISNNIENSGSIGLTMVLEPYTLFEIKKGEEAEIFFNNEKIEFPNLEYLKKKLGNLILSAHTKIPLGFGYGMSGSISLAYALGSIELLGKKEDEAIKVAHESEVISGNGLGDVISQYYGGGLVYRKEPGYRGKVEIIDIEWKKICSKPIEAIPTKSILKESTIALDYIKEFLQNKTIEKFFELSRKFNENLGFKSPYPRSFRKKGLIVRLEDCNEQSWITHSPAKKGAYVI
ncbi:pantoate kinase [Acidianus sulfidivorans]|uniref:pantoate kinase n=1 Tax=Acidianus sulfidivorans TaxID=312539 RepID=UPI00197B72AD|nr:pantoate kinase [Acidianus sulfidivorans]